MRNTLMFLVAPLMAVVAMNHINHIIMNHIILNHIIHMKHINHMNHLQLIHLISKLSIEAVTVDVDVSDDQGASVAESPNNLLYAVVFSILIKCNTLYDIHNKYFQHVFVLLKLLTKAGKL